MFEIKGKYNKAYVYANTVNYDCIQQITNMCNQEWIKGSRISIMPDCHFGKGCVVGFTATIQNKVCPNLVGNDIGCGMLTVELGKVDINYEKLDNYLRGTVNGMKEETNFNFKSLRCYEHINVSKAKKYTGTLGSGNHFVEIDEDSEGNKYLIIHSGSRSLGQQVHNYYQRIAEKHCEGKNIQKEFTYLKGEELDNYLHDILICQIYAQINRKLIAIGIMKQILSNKLPINMFHTIHNYIDTEHKILRKGAISAQEGELVLIPMNMRDGCLLAEGKGNPHYNFSAPHGAGRLFSRSQAKEILSLDDFEKSMEGIYTSCVTQSKIDESPMAYKPMDEILDNIKDTVSIIKVLKPVYNYKAR